jgi:hypothetical protein
LVEHRHDSLDVLDSSSITNWQARRGSTTTERVMIIDTLWQFATRSVSRSDRTIFGDRYPPTESSKIIGNEAQSLGSVFAWRLPNFHPERLVMSITPDRARDRAVKGQSALSRKFLDQACGDRELAEQLRREHYRRLQRKSAQKRHQKRAAKLAAELRALEARAGLHITTDDELERVAREQVRREAPL